MASLGNFHVRQTQMLVGTKNFPFIFLKYIENNSVLSDTHTEVQKYFLFTALCGMP